ncbi:hypothetical protein [Cysteiniphilum halobium]|uniref:hypothetical protein n=1 Tax=Cysteiniphilum halobium TaxID=2219059 RepID=UPI000E659BDA|nr:hypothetical protein [Cysteiniphilum halobium]
MSLLQSKIKNIYQELLHQRQQFEFKKPLLAFLNQLHQEHDKIKHLQNQLDQLLTRLHRYLKAAALAHRHNETISEEMQEALDQNLEEIKTFYQELRIAYEDKRGEFQEQLKQERVDAIHAETFSDSDNQVIASMMDIPKDAPMTIDQIKDFVDALDRHTPCQLSFDLTEHGLQNTIAVVREMLNCQWLKENICLNPCKSQRAKLNNKCLAYIDELSCMLSPNGEYQPQYTASLFNSDDQFQSKLNVFACTQGG